MTLISVILVLLIKVLPNKRLYRDPINLCHLDDLTFRQSGNGNMPMGNVIRDSYRSRLILRNSDILDGGNEVSDPLLCEGDVHVPMSNCRTYAVDRPPSYSEVVGDQSDLGEPPPPYTSTECLNVQRGSSLQDTSFPIRNEGCYFSSKL